MAIAPETIYTKTAKGILEVKNKTVKLSRELGLIFLSVDGKASVGDLQPRSGMTPAQLQHALNALVTDGYIKVVSHGAPQVAVNNDNFDFTQKQVIATVNAEAASHALAAADAVKRAQAEAKAALEARLRQEAEARARALAEARATSEAEAKAKAEEAARAAAEERAHAEREAERAADPAARAQAETRGRNAAAAVVRAQAEARVRAEAEGRARAQAEEKRLAEEEAGKESEARTTAEQQAQSRAAAEGRAKELLEAQLKAMETVRAIADPNSSEAELARARLREIENEAERAREAARDIAAAEGRANEVPQPEMDIAERVRQLHARVAAQRQEHQPAKPDPLAVEFESDQPRAAGETYSALRLDTVPVAEPPKPLDDIPMVVIPPDDEPVRTPAPALGQPAAPAEPSPLPVVEIPSALPEVNLDLDRATAPPPPAMADNQPTALERAMTEMAARQQARKEQQEAPQQEKPKPDPAAKTQPIVFELPKTPEGEQKDAPTIVLEGDEPFDERLNVDRASHDAIAETIEARRKAEAAQLSQGAVEARRRRAEEEARRVAAAETQRKRRKFLQSAIIAAIALPTLAVLWLQFATMNGYIPEAQRTISQRLNQPVQIQNLRYVLLPTPRLTLEDVWIGSGKGVKVRKLEARVNPFAALAGPTSFDVVEAEGVEIDPEIFATIPKWTGGQPADTIRVNNLRISDLKLNMPGESLGTFNGTVAFAANGTVKDAAFENDKVRLTLTPSPEGVRVALDATGWRVPYGPPLTFDRLKLSGLVDEKQVAAGQFSGTLAAGNIEGAVNARWGGSVAVQGEFKLDNARLLDLTRDLTSNFQGRGTLRANGRFSMQGADWSAVRATPQIEAAFSISRGELTNIDLVRAIQSAAPGAMRGGRTAFENLSGMMQLSGDRVAFRQLQLSSGALNASGTMDVAANGQLSGRFNAQLASGGGGVIARSSLGVVGTVADPNLTR